MFRYLLPLLLLAGCGGYIDAELVQYVDEFRVEAESRGLRPSPDLGISVEYGETPNKSVAFCEYGLFRNRVLVNRERWGGVAFPLEKKALMFHEFGHCVLGREHVSDTEQSLMIAKPIHVLFENSWSTLVDELFTPE